MLITDQVAIAPVLTVSKRDTRLLRQSLAMLEPRAGISQRLRRNPTYPLTAEEADVEVAKINC